MEATPVAQAPQNVIQSWFCTVCGEVTFQASQVCITCQYHGRQK